MNRDSRKVPAARELARWLRRRFEGAIVDVLLYGSVARGTHDSLSDIDLLVLVSRPLSLSEREELSKRASDLDLKHGTVTQCLVRTVAEWEQPGVQCGGLADEVAREGVSL